MRERKIPTILGLFLVIGAVMIFRTAFDTLVPYFAKADTTNTPNDIVFTNISDTGFTVTWLTSEPSTGAITLDSKPKSGTYYDERDMVAGGTAVTIPGTYKTHSVSVRDLSPETTYHIGILSNSKTYGDDTPTYTIRTGKTLSGGGLDMEPAYGNVTLPTGNPAAGSLVYLTPDGGQTLSALVSPTGSWVIPLHLVRTQDLNGFLYGGERIGEKIIVRSAEGDSQAQTDTINDNPVPDMTIGKDYDFRKIQAQAPQNQPVAVVTTPKKESPAVLGTSATASGKVDIVKPAQNAFIPSNLPLFQGTGIPGAKVLLLIGIQRPVSDTVTVGTDGIWYYTPVRPLAEGKQSITITTVDVSKRTVAITHAFEILKSGTQVLGDATPSATLTPSPTMYIAEATPTPTATLAGDPIPQTGFPLPLIILLLLGTMLLGGGTYSLLR